MRDRLLAGTVADAELCSPMDGVSVAQLGERDELIASSLSDRQGRWRARLSAATRRIEFRKRGYGAKTYRPGELPGLVRLLEDRLIGYQQRIWFNPGDSVTAYVHAPSTQREADGGFSYRASLFRHGRDKTLALEVRDLPALRQRTPDDHFVADGLDWTPAFEYTIPANARPGIFSLKLEAPGQESFAIPMVVSTPAEKRGRDSRLLVLASTNNWQTYNIWGGRNRYRNFETAGSADFMRDPRAIATKGKRLAARALKGLLPKPAFRVLRKVTGQTPAWSFYPLHIRRPFTNCALEEDDPRSAFTSHLAAGEWRVLAWLEREGYSYDIATGVELHRDSSLLERYDALVLSTHCEYWSRPMYDGLLAFHQRNGGWVVNLGGNTLFREVTFLDDGSLRCVSLSFADSCADETQVIGVRYTADDYGTCAAYRARDREHWVFRGVPLEADGVFGRRSLNRATAPPSERYNPGRPGVDEGGLTGQGASGWETDKLSDTAPSDFLRVAKGLNARGGADMVVREPNGARGGMFSASSITFGGALLIDPAISTITRNVLDRALHRAGNC